MKPRFMVSWSKDGSLRKRQTSQPLYSFDAALDEGVIKAVHNKSVTVLKEGEGVNAGTFYLDYIVK